MIPGFLQGTAGVVQVVNVLTRRLPRLALNNVRRDRRRGTAELIYKSISLVFGELSDRTVDLQDEPVRLLPDIEFPPGCQEYPCLSPSCLTCARASLLPVPLLRSPLPPNPRGHSLTRPLNNYSPLNASALRGPPQLFTDHSSLITGYTPLALPQRSTLQQLQDPFGGLEVSVAAVPVREMVIGRPHRTRRFKVQALECLD